MTFLDMVISSAFFLALGLIVGHAFGMRRLNWILRQREKVEKEYRDDIREHFKAEISQLNEEIRRMKMFGFKKH